MKALSLWQPWASLFVLSHLKLYETRHWATSYRGPLLVHAAKKICVDVDHALNEILVAEFGYGWPKDLPRGALLGIVNLVACDRTESIRVDYPEQACGNFAPGRFGWKKYAPRRFEKPVPYRGMQGLFNVPSDVVASLPGAIVTTESPRQRSMF